MIRTSLLICTLALVGCGGSAKTTPVAGVVMLDGKPLPGASIQFVAQGKGRDATAETDKNGEFTMSTFQPRDGMLAGSYKVVISQPIGVADTKQYATADEAMAAAAKAPAKKEATPGVPQKYSRSDLTPLTQEIPAKGKLTFELKSN